MVWWNEVEDSSTPMEERKARLAERCFRPAVGQRGMVGVKATDRSTGEIVGMALWYINSPEASGGLPTSYPDMEGVTVPDHFVPFVYRSSNASTLGWAARMGWDEERRRQLYAHVRPWLDERMVGYDRGRLAEMGSRAHLYVGPICVDRRYRRRGVGGMLMRWGMAVADAARPAMPVVLDAFPNARPVYYHLGFKQVRDNLLVRWPAEGEGV